MKFDRLSNSFLNCKTLVKWHVILTVMCELFTAFPFCEHTVFFPHVFGSFHLLLVIDFLGYLATLPCPLQAQFSPSHDPLSPHSSISVSILGPRANAWSFMKCPPKQPGRSPSPLQNSLTLNFPVGFSLLITFWVVTFWGTVCIFLQEAWVPHTCTWS